MIIFLKNNLNEDIQMVELSSKIPLVHSSAPGSAKKNNANIASYLLGDNSIDKAVFNQKKADRLIEIVKNKEKNLYLQRAVRTVSVKRRLIQENWESFVRDEILEYSLKTKCYDFAAIKIQKIVRGFLVRIKFDPMMLHIREANNEHMIKELRKQTDTCMLTLGSNTVPAVKSIQSAYRRYLFRKKLEVMKACYVLYLKDREEFTCNFLRQAFWNYSCKIKKDYLVFLKYRVKRLEEIKENIAILTVKKIWRAKKFTFKIVKEKFIRIKRRRAAMQNKEQYQKYLATLGGPGKKEGMRKKSEANSKDSKAFAENKTDEKHHENKEDNPEEDEEYKEAQRIKEIIESRIKEKVSKSKMAYAIDDCKTKVVMPMMQERAINESLDHDTIASKLLNLTISVFAKGKSLTREKPETSRNLQIFSPRTVSQRKHYDGALLPPLSFGPLPEAPLEGLSTARIRPVDNEHFLTTTVSSLNKTGEPILSQWKRQAIERAEAREEKEQRSKRVTRMKTKAEQNLFEGRRLTKEFQAKERVYPWIPVARRFTTYVPGIDNAGYIPIKWSPLRLNKRILTARLNTVVKPRHNSAVVSPTSVIAMDGEEVMAQTSKRLKRIFKDPTHSFSPSTQDQSIEFASFN